MAKKKVGVVVGSIRTGSLTRMVAKAMCGLVPDLECEILEIKQLSMFNQDFEKTPPQDWLDFKAKVKACDAILFATPEYNRSIPGVLKNAIDVASRPYGQSAWSKKPCAVVSVSPGAIGGFGANHHLRQCLVFLEMPALQMEAYIGHAAKLFDASGDLTADDTRAFLTKIMQAFGAWIDANPGK
ncbi:MAG TPA: NAD(P)H-dependent oxidoreductase [Usitatibacter sp.]|nr:NAD(P)H-dependent oxidoreductase [Usitatibacter sp.]